MGLLNVYSYAIEKTVKLSDTYQVFIYLTQEDYEQLLAHANNDLAEFAQDGGTINGKVCKLIELFGCTKVKLPSFSFKEESYIYGNFRRNMLIPDYQSVGNLELTLLEHYDDPLKVTSNNYDPAINNNLLCIQSYVDLFLSKLFDMEHFAYKLHDYIPKIEVRITSNDFSKYVMVYEFTNLKLISYDSYDLDYSSTSPIEWNLQFAFQGYNYGIWDEAQPDKPAEETPDTAEKPEEAPVDNVTPSTPPAPPHGGNRGPDLSGINSGNASPHNSSQTPSHPSSVPGGNVGVKGINPAGSGNDSTEPESAKNETADAAGQAEADAKMQGIAPAGASHSPDLSGMNSGNAAPHDQTAVPNEPENNMEGIEPAGTDPNEQWKFDDWRNATAPTAPGDNEDTAKAVPPVDATKPAESGTPNDSETIVTESHTEHFDNSIDYANDKVTKGIASSTEKTTQDIVKEYEAAKDAYDVYDNARNEARRAAEEAGRNGEMAESKFDMNHGTERANLTSNLLVAANAYNAEMATEAEGANQAAMIEGQGQGAVQEGMTSRAARIPPSMYGPQESSTSNDDSSAQIPETASDQPAEMPDMSPSDRLMDRSANTGSSDGHNETGGDAMAKAAAEARERAEHANDSEIVFDPGVEVNADGNYGNAPDEIDHNSGMPSVSKAPTVASLDESSLDGDTSTDKPTFNTIDANNETPALKGMPTKVSISTPSEKTQSSNDNQTVDAKSKLNYDPIEDTGLRDRTSNDEALLQFAEEYNAATVQHTTDVMVDSMNSEEFNNYAGIGSDNVESLFGMKVAHDSTGSESNYEYSMLNINQKDDEQKTKELLQKVKSGEAKFVAERYLGQEGYMENGGIATEVYIELQEDGKNKRYMVASGLERSDALIADPDGESRWYINKTKDKNKLAGSANHAFHQNFDADSTTGLINTNMTVDAYYYDYNSGKMIKDSKTKAGGVNTHSTQYANQGVGCLLIDAPTVKNKITNNTTDGTGDKHQNKKNELNGGGWSKAAQVNAASSDTTIGRTAAGSYTSGQNYSQKLASLAFDVFGTNYTANGAGSFRVENRYNAGSTHHINSLPSKKNT